MRNFKTKLKYLRGQPGDQAWKVSRNWIKSSRIGDPTGRNVEPCLGLASMQLPVFSWIETITLVYWSSSGPFGQSMRQSLRTSASQLVSQ